MADNTVNGADNKEVIEAVLTASEYCKKLERALGNVAFEFENGKADDTEDYAKSILEGVNWTIQVYNATLRRLVLRLTRMPSTRQLRQSAKRMKMTMTMPRQSCSRVSLRTLSVQSHLQAEELIELIN